MNTSFSKRNTNLVSLRKTEPLPIKGKPYSNEDTSSRNAESSDEDASSSASNKKDEDALSSAANDK